MKKRALISVFDKSNVVEFAEGLTKLGYEIISTGGTLKLIQEAGISATGVDDITGFPEILGGRVKTLHPKVHGGLLAKRSDESHQAELAENVIYNNALIERLNGKFRTLNTVIKGGK